MHIKTFTWAIIGPTVTAFFQLLDQIAEILLAFIQWVSDLFKSYHQLMIRW